MSMFIWVALEMESQMPETKRDIRKIASTLGREDLPCFSLPLHLSLKISFPVPDGEAGDVRSAVREIFAGITPFPVSILGAERRGGLIWLRAKPSPELVSLHETLDRVLAERFGVPQAPYDRDFRFHITLFQGLTGEEAARALGSLEEAIIPVRPWAKTWLIGSSPDGVPGTYRIDLSGSFASPGI